MKLIKISIKNLGLELLINNKLRGILKVSRALESKLIQFYFILQPLDKSPSIIFVFATFGHDRTK